MAIDFTVPGICAIKLNTGTSGAWEDLGRCQDGVSIREMLYSEEVHGDDRGGPQGPPVDINYLGEAHNVRLQLYRYDPAVLSKVAGRVKTTAKSEGAVMPPGHLLVDTADAFQLVIDGSGFTRKYERAIPTGAIEIGRVGPHHAVWALEFLCLANDSDVLYTLTYT